jgi:hypothetical protein
MVYEGEWKNGRQHGRGVYIDVDGSRKEGLWQKGVNVAID